MSDMCIDQYSPEVELASARTTSEVSKALISWLTVEEVMAARPVSGSGSVGDGGDT